MDWLLCVCGMWVDGEFYAAYIHVGEGVHSHIWVVWWQKN